VFAGGPRRVNYQCRYGSKADLLRCRNDFRSAPYERTSSKAKTDISRSRWITSLTTSLVCIDHLAQLK
jgi:hypothetical protein